MVVPPGDAEGASTIWLVPSSSPGLAVAGPFVGVGLRGNDSSPVTAANVGVPHSSMLGGDGEGFGIMINTVLPVFAVLSAAFQRPDGRRPAPHPGAHHHHHPQRYRRHPGRSAHHSQLRRAHADQGRYVGGAAADTVAAIDSQRADAMLRVLECKAAAAESANEVLDLAMRVCGGAASRREAGVERFFRDARAAGVMAPTTDVLYDFIGKAVCGIPLFR